MRLSRAAAVAVCALVAGLGCIPIETNSDPDSPQPPEEVASGSPVSDYNEAEPNDTYTEAEALIIANEITLGGALAPASNGQTDRDIFELGPVATGDRITGSLDVDPGLDVVMGLLDADGRLLGFVNPRSSSSGPPAIDLIVHESSSRLYVVMSTRTSFSSAQPYTARIAIERLHGMGPFRPQAVVLDFEGGNAIAIGNRLPVNVPRFDAATLGARFAGRTDEIVGLVLEKVRADYDGLNVDIYRSGNPGIPAEHSVVYFGSYDESLLGLADNIDPFNENRIQAAILYTDTFALFNVLNPSVEQMAQVLANVTSHEIGHLLGLRHTADPAGVMDVTASARQMLQDQYFTTSRLYERVLPIGVQDAPAMLSWTLGGALQPRTAMEKLVARERIMAVAGEADDFHLPMRLLGSACGLDDQNDYDADLGHH